MEARIMFMDAENFKGQVEILARNINHDFYEKRKTIEELLEQVDPHGFSWIGSAEHEIFYDLKSAKRYFAEQRRKMAVPVLDIREERYVAQLLTPEVCVVICEYIVETPPQTEQIISEHQRVTFVVRQDEDGRMWICHIHTSNPWAIMRHDEYFPTKIGRRNYEYMEELMQKQKFKEIKELTKRQNQILFQMMQGKTYAQIAEILGIKERTVRYHITEICNRYHVAGRKQLMAYFFEHSSSVDEKPAFAGSSMTKK